MIKTSEDNCQPFKMEKIGRNKRWMTPEIKQKIQLHQSLFFNGPIEEHTKLSKEVAHLISRAINSSTIETSQLVNQTIGKKSKTSKTKSIGVSQEQAVELNTAFHAVWNGQKHPDLSTSINPNCTKPKQEIFTYHNVSQVFKNIKSKSVGPDNLCPILLKSARLELTPIIVELGNMCINNSYVPTQHKKSHITPIGKIPIPLTPKDFRPISNISILDKIYQRVIAKFIISYTI